MSFRESEDDKLVPLDLEDFARAKRMLASINVEEDGLKPIKEILHKAFRNTYQKEVKQLPLSVERSVLSAGASSDDKNIALVDPEGVARMAQSMEALVAMSDGVADDQTVTIQATLSDFRSFVCYMRELDLSYRSILNLAAEQVEKAKEKREKPRLIIPGRNGK